MSEGAVQADCSLCTTPGGCQELFYGNHLLPFHFPMLLSYSYIVLPAQHWDILQGSCFLIQCKTENNRKGMEKSQGKKGLHSTLLLLKGKLISVLNRKFKHNKRWMKTQVVNLISVYMYVFRV